MVKIQLKIRTRPFPPLTPLISIFSVIFAENTREL